MIHFSCFVLCTLALAQGPAPGGPPTAKADDWKLEVVHRKAPFAPLEGLVVREDQFGIELRQVIRKPGRPTFIITIQIPTEQVEQVDLLDSEERAQLMARLDQIVTDRGKWFARFKLLDKPLPIGKNLADIPPGFERAFWPGDQPGTNRAWQYSGQRFTLLTTVRVDIAELCALQLEQVFNAYERLLPARQESGPVLVLVTSSVEEWQALCKAKGHLIRNPAWCDPIAGEVGLATDQVRLDARMVELRSLQNSQLTELQVRGDELRKAYGGKLPAELQKPFDLSLKSLRETATRNEQVLRQERDRLFARMNHEAFHAYLARFVLPPGRGVIPPWLNEGLAQIFESALVEAGELRADLADPARVKLYRADIQAGTDLPLADLLTLPVSKFHVTDNSSQETSRQAYLTSWALCSWLVLEKNRLRLDDLEKLSLAEMEKVPAQQNFESVFAITLAEAQTQMRETFKKAAPGQRRNTPPPSESIPKP